MRYAAAMGMLNRDRTAYRPGTPDVKVAKRFGNYVLLNADPSARPAYIGWTPTREEMSADDWIVADGDGEPVEQDRALNDRDTPLTTGAARGGTGAGTGWKRA